METEQYAWSSAHRLDRAYLPGHRCDEFSRSMAVRAVKSALAKLRQKHENRLLLYWAFDRLTSALSRLNIRLFFSVIYREGHRSGEPPRLTLTDCTTEMLPGKSFGELIDVEGYSIGPDDLAERFANGAECFVLRHKGSIVALTWCQLDGPPHPRLGLSFGPEDAYLFDAYTAPACRGRRLLPYLRYQLYGSLRQRGRSRLLSATEVFNCPSHRFKRQLAAEPLVLRTFLRIGRGRGRVFTLYRFRSEAAES